MYISFISYLNPKNSKNKKESTANDDNVADGFEAGKKSLDHKLQTRCPIDHSQWPQGSNQAENTKHPEKSVIFP